MDYPFHVFNIIICYSINVGFVFLVSTNEPKGTPVGAPYSFASSTSTYVAPSALYPTYSKSIGSTPRGSGIDSKLLPHKYRRKSLEQEEIDYIAV